MPVINTNIAALTALRYTNVNTAAQNKLLSQLSSGLRVQTASDDAAALSIGAKIKSASTTLAQAAINASTAQSVLNTAEGGYASIANILERLKAISTAAQSGIPDSTALSNADKEFQALLSEITSVTTATRFNNVSLLGGAAGAGLFSDTGGANILLGSSSSDTINIKFSAATLAGLSLTGLSVTSAANASTAASSLDAAIGTLAGFRSQTGADTSRVIFRSSLINVSKENSDASASALLDADVAATQTAYTNADVLTQSGIAALQKANAIPQQLLRLLQS